MTNNLITDLKDLADKWQGKSMGESVCAMELKELIEEHEG